MSACTLPMRLPSELSSLEDAVGSRVATRRCLLMGSVTADSLSSEGTSIRKAELRGGFHPCWVPGSSCACWTWLGILSAWKSPLCSSLMVFIKNAGTVTLCLRSLSWVAPG